MATDDRGLQDQRIFLADGCRRICTFAHAIISRVLKSVADVNHAVSKISLDGSGKDVVTPEQTPREFEPIFGVMGKRTKYLRRIHDRLAKAISAGEKLRKELTKKIATNEVEIEVTNIESP